MLKLKQILCPIDMSDLSFRAVAYGGSVASWYDGTVTALHVVPSFEPMEVRAGALFDPVQFVQPMPRAEVVDRLREAMRTAGVAIERIEAAAEAGDPASVIVDQAVARKSDVLVMATHGRSGFDRLVLGSVTEKVLRRAPCPVLTVPPHAPASPSSAALRRILCPIDVSPAALQAVGLAFDLARRSNASLTVLQVIEWLTEEEPFQHARFDVVEFRQHLTEDTRTRLDVILAELGPVDGHAEVRVGVGRAHREILRVAEEGGADLIVMGAQGRGAPTFPALGSTTQQVVRAASCPVLTVRAPLLDA